MQYTWISTTVRTTKDGIAVDMNTSEQPNLIAPEWIINLCGGAITYTRTSEDGYEEVPLGQVPDVIRCKLYDALANARSLIRSTFDQCVSHFTAPGTVFIEASKIKNERP
jgi:hypothetical protein